VFELAAQVTLYTQAIAAQQGQHTQKLQAYTAQYNGDLATEALVIGTATPGTADYGKNLQYRNCNMYMLCMLRL
jgi:hypothetical protein